MFRYQKLFWNTEVFFYEMFQYGETKQFVRKIVIPTHCLILNIFRYQSFSKTQKGFSTNFSVVWDGKLLNEIVNILPPLTHLSIKCFDTTFFLKHRRFPLRCFSILWDINFSTESSDVPCVFILKIFRCQIFFEIERTMYKVFRH